MFTPENKMGMAIMITFIWKESNSNKIQNEEIADVPYNYLEAVYCR